MKEFVLVKLRVVQQADAHLVSQASQQGVDDRCLAGADPTVSIRKPCLQSRRSADVAIPSRCASLRLGYPRQALIERFFSEAVEFTIHRHSLGLRD